MGDTKMKMIRIFFRGIKEAFKSVVRNMSLSLASISAISITLSIVALSLISSDNVTAFTSLIKDDVTMVVIVDKKATDKDNKRIEESINKLDNVLSVEFKSKFTQKNEMMKKSDVFRVVLESFNDDELPLQDSFMVKVKDLAKISDTEEDLKNIKGIQYVNYGRSMVNKLLSATEIIEKIMWFVVVTLLVVTIFLIINTIKLTIYNRQKEIEIKRLVGVSNNSIKFPFLVEGIILGAIGSIAPILITTIGYTKIYNHFDGILFAQMFKLLPPASLALETSLIILGIGVLVGIIGSLSAVRKYLKV